MLKHMYSTKNQHNNRRSELRVYLSWSSRYLAKLLATGLIVQYQTRILRPMIPSQFNSSHTHQGILAMTAPIRPRRHIKHVSKGSSDTATYVGINKNVNRCLKYDPIFFPHRGIWPARWTPHSHTKRPLAFASHLAKDISASRAVPRIYDRRLSLTWIYRLFIYPVCTPTIFLRYAWCDPSWLHNAVNHENLIDSFGVNLCTIFLANHPKLPP